MRNIFRLINDERSRLSQQRLQVSDTQALDYQDSLLDSIYAFVKDYGVRKLSIDDYFFTLVSIGASDSDIGIHLGITENYVRRLKSRLTERVLDILGYQIFNLVSKATTETKYNFLMGAISSIQQGTTSTSVLPLDLISSIKKKSEPSPTDLYYTVSDCKSELKFLRQYSLASIEQKLGTLDISKLMYLLSILDLKDGTITDYKNILDVVQKP